MSAPAVAVWVPGEGELTRLRGASGLDALPKLDRAIVLLHISVCGDGDARRDSSRGELLRRVLSAFLGSPVCERDLKRNARGKPLLLGAGLASFSVSYSGAWLAIGLSRNGAVGIDIERVRPLPDLPQVLSMLHSSEANAVRSNGKPLERFYSIWTRKEALLKGTGEGIAGVGSDLGLVDAEGRDQCQAASGGMVWEIDDFRAEGLRGAVAWEQSPAFRHPPREASLDKQ